MYAKVKCDDLNQHRRNPFYCPVTDCSHCMTIHGNVPELVPEDSMVKVRQWEYELSHPPCWSLVCCLSSRCGKEGSIRWHDSDANIVFCEECEVRWCILCLKLHKVDASGHSHHHECDRSQVMKLCRRYLACTSDTIKQKCETKYPWIQIYSKSQLDDDACLEWINSNGGQTCPTCSTGIERIEGCFHMQCQCGTHFCYECGEELHPPYYGTHHCWEQSPDDS